MEDDEVSRILDRMARKIIERMHVELDLVGIGSPHGVYAYNSDRDKWVLIRTKGNAFTPKRDGIYVIYFDNTECPACRVYDLVWYPLAKALSKRIKGLNFMVVLCAWFSLKCSSEAASKSFTHYRVFASPTTVLLFVRNGKIVHEDRFEGVKEPKEFISKIREFIRSCRS